MTHFIKIFNLLFIVFIRIIDKESVYSHINIFI